MFGKFENYITEVMRGNKRGLFSSLIRLFLHLLSFPYRLIVFSRNWLYDHEWFRQYQPPVPVVISIGNLVAGGSGKTPATLMVAAAFYGQNLLGILSRGYRSPAEKLPSPVMLCAGKGPLHSAAYCGDEPYLLADNLPESFIFVGRDRYKSANMAAKSGVELLLLDDGMQHRRLDRDYDVVVVDGSQCLASQYYLPRGFLRESLASLSRADLVLINHIEDEAQFEKQKETLSKFSAAPMIGTRLDVDRILNLQGEGVAALSGKKVGVFCAIANPANFLKTVQSLGAEVVATEYYPDHYNFQQDRLTQLIDKFHAMGAEMVVCTEKDKVKIPNIPNLPVPIVWVKMKLVLVAGEEEWNRFLGKVKKDLSIRVRKEDK